MEEEKTFKIQKSTLYGTGIFLLLIMGGLFMLQDGGKSQTITGNVVLAGNGEV